jgi:hypothetical protein
VDEIKECVTVVADEDIARNLKMTVFWDIAQCSLVEINRRLRVVYGFDNRGATSQKTSIFRLIAART